jgi:hypothetical protein
MPSAPALPDSGIALPIKDRQHEEPSALSTVVDVVGEPLDGHAPDVPMNDRCKVGMFRDDL